ncbi:EamA family transporter [Spirosoma taeanense]|uniref:EamA family transporter n=1 Tax=Spirosoma taeanense TaxID=2735870 RepID=A0A6M5YCH5_9BACT|nr:DMT family transporter [Spirosoma taeanense]QJW91798.1 EamA family transporter [Spirosoma taeanense]
MLLAILTFTSFAVLIRILANPLSNVFQKQLTQRAADPLFVISATYGFLTVACLAFWPQLRLTGLPVAFWQSMLVVGALAMFGNVFLVKALQIGDLSVLGPINAYKSVVGLIFGIFLLNEVPGWWGLTGVILIVVGSYVVLSNAQQHKPFSWTVFQRPEVKLRLAALVFSAIDGTFLKKAIVLSTPTIAFFYWCLFGFGFTLVWILLTMRSQWRAQTKLLLSHKIIYLGLFVAVGVTQIASNVALAGMPVGYALALFQTSALVSVLFGYQFFKERGIVRKLIGASIMVAGAVLITVLG